MNELEPVASADQDGWVDLAQRIRLEIEKLVPQIPAMKPDEMKAFVDTAQSSLWLCQLAKITASD